MPPAASRWSALPCGSCARPGRSLPEYRAIRERHAFFEVARTPELCAEVTLQPVRRHGVDAAVMFADIMTPVVEMGIDVELVEGVGPVVERPVRSAADVERLHVPEAEAFEPVLEAVRIVRGELGRDKAVIGFCGGPFTVAGYLVEGRPSRELPRTKALMLGEPGTWEALMAVLAETFARYVAAKVAAGADVIQVFDSWVGTLSPQLYRDHVAPWTTRILEAVDVPTIHFGTGASHLLPDLARAGGDVIGLDWRLPLDDGWALVGRPRRAGEPRSGRARRALGRRGTGGARCTRAGRRPRGPCLQPRPRGAPGHRSLGAHAPHELVHERSEATVAA